MTIRNCEGCQFLNKKKKTNPCKKDFKAVYDAKSGIYKRPSSCKNKPKKVNPRKELQKIKDEVVNLFQTYIRYRDNFTCCTCGFSVSSSDKDAKKLIHAGHVISRKINQLLLDEKNCHAQCRNCNFLQDKLGISPKYLSFLIKKYGQEIFDYYINKMNSNDSIDWYKERDKWEKKLYEIKKMH